MRRFQRTLVAVIIAPLLTLAACGDEDTPTGPAKVPEVHSVTVAPQTVTMRIGENVVLLATVEADSGADKTVTWQSIDPRRVTVSATGILTAVSAGTGIVIAKSVADTTKTATVSVTVTPGRGITSLTPTPSAVTLNPGETQAIAVNMDAEPGISRAVTFTSGDAAIATVSTTGTITAVAAGSTTITVASVLDPTVTATVGVTVRAPKQAVIFIQSITSGSTTTPVDILNVRGQIDVTLSIDPGDERLSRVDLVFNDGVRDTVVASLTFAGDRITDDSLRAEAASTPVVLSVNTAAYNLGTGAVAFKNGNQQVRANAQVRFGTSTATRSSTGPAVTLANMDGFHIMLSQVSSTAVNRARDQNGLEWVQAGKGLVVRSLPVMYSGRTVTVRTIGFPASAPVARTTSTAGGVSTDTLMLPDYSTPATGTAYTLGELPLVSAVDNRGAAIPLVGAGANGAGIVNAQLFTPEPLRINGIRVDNVPPPAGAKFELSNAGGATGNWIGGTYEFKSGLTTIPPDAGVGLPGDNTAPTATTALVRFLASGEGLAVEKEVQAGGDLEATSANSAYEVKAVYADRLNNTRTVSLTPTASHPLSTVGVDLTPPVIRLGTTPPAGAAFISTSLDSVFISLTADGKQLTFGAEVVDDRAGLTDTSVTVSLTRFAPPGLLTCVIGTPAQGGGCNPVARPLATTLPDFFRQLAVPLDGGTGVEGYYTFVATAHDRAGNQSTVVSKRALYDKGTGTSAPLATGVAMPPSLLGGKPAPFAPLAADNIELGRGVLYVAYPNLPAPGTVLAYDGPQGNGFPIGTAFDTQLTTTVPAGVAFTIPNFIRGLESTSAANEPQAYPAATAKPTAANVVVRDLTPTGAPGTLATNVPILAALVESPQSATPGFAALTGATRLSQWRPNAAATGTVRFEAVGPSGQTVSPFARVLLARLETGVAPNTQIWRVIGEVTSATGTDNGQQRIWTYDFGNRPTGTHIAIGVTAAGDAIVTQPAGGGGGGGGGSGTGTVAGTVMSPQLGNLGNVSISVTGGFTATTAANGSYSISRVTAGSRTVSITGGLPQGCSAPADQTVTVSASATTTVNFTVTCQVPTGSVSGTITSSVGGGIPGVLVTLTPSGGGALPAVTTNASGAFSFTAVAVGDASGSITLASLPGGCTNASPYAYTGLTSGGSLTKDITVACGAAPEFGSLTGTIRRSNNNAVVQGVTVTLAPGSGTAPAAQQTNAQGVYTFSSNVPTGGGSITLSTLPSGCTFAGESYAGVTNGGSVTKDLTLDCGAAQQTYPLTATWSPIESGTVELTFSINMGTAPGDPNINGANADRFVGIQANLSFDNSKLSFASVEATSLQIGLVSGSSTGGTAVFACAVTSTNNASLVGNVQICKMVFNVAPGATGSVTPTLTVSEATAGVLGQATEVAIKDRVAPITILTLTIP
jgi:hypothetical protein